MKYICTKYPTICYYSIIPRKKFYFMKHIYTKYPTIFYY